MAVQDNLLRFEISRQWNGDPITDHQQKIEIELLTGEFPTGPFTL